MKCVVIDANLLKIISSQITIKCSSCLCFVSPSGISHLTAWTEIILAVLHERIDNSVHIRTKLFLGAITNTSATLFFAGCINKQLITYVYINGIKKAIRQIFPSWRD